jgi:predicted membrane channel-forming protein YqfA (hemolysin III family)
MESDTTSNENVTQGKRDARIGRTFSLQVWPFSILNAKRCSRAPTYINGLARPQCRGLFHLLIFLILTTAALPSLLFYIFQGNLGRKWWKLVFFFLAKASLYGCSMYYHIFPHRNLQDFYSAEKMDLLTIPISGFANSILIHETFSEFLIVGAMYVSIILITGLVVYLEYEYPKHPCCSRNLRLTLNAVQFLIMLVHNGVFVGLRYLWLMAYASYIIAFAAFFSSRDPTLTWHKSGIYGSHEDFHFFVFIGDFVVMLRGILFLENPTIMNDSSAHFQNLGTLFN